MSDVRFDNKGFLFGQRKLKPGQQEFLLVFVFNSHANELFVVFMRFRQMSNGHFFGQPVLYLLVEKVSRNKTSRLSF